MKVIDGINPKPKTMQQCQERWSDLLAVQHVSHCGRKIRVEAQ